MRKRHKKTNPLRTYCYKAQCEADFYKRTNSIGIYIYNTSLMFLHINYSYVSEFLRIKSITSCT